MSDTALAVRHSENIADLADALSKAQGEMDGAKKDAVNPHFKSKYADLESVWDACRAPLSKHGLSVMQPVSGSGRQVCVTTMLTHKSGQWIASDLFLTAVQDNPQSVGSAITYGRRYGLSSMVGIAPEDDDGNAAAGSGSKEAAQAVAAQKMQDVPPETAAKYGKPKAQAQLSVDENSPSFKQAIDAFDTMKADICKYGSEQQDYRDILLAAGFKNKAEAVKSGPTRSREVYLKLADRLKALKREKEGVA